MKIGRNDLCPCGSGKKYKKCCYLQNENLQTEINLNEFATDDFEDEDDNDLLNYLENTNSHEFLLQTMTKLRSYTLNSKSHIKEYYKIRKMHSEIVNSMVDYNEADKFELKIDSSYIYKHERPIDNKGTSSWIETNFKLETREGIQALYDFLIYKAAPNMNSITEDFIKSHRYRKPEKVEFLNSMLNSTIGLFEVVKTDFNEGYAYLKNIFTNIEYKTVDIGLSGSKNYNAFYMYTRLIKYNDIVFNTGLNLIFDKKDSFIKSHINNHKKNYIPEGELRRFTQLYNYCSKHPNKIEIFANTIK
jgi:hypothetical protein